MPIWIPPQAMDIPAVRPTQPIVIDGVIDPAEWAGVPVFSGRGFDSENGNEGPEQTEYRIAYDAQFIYFSAKLSDSQPKRVRSTAFRPNVSLEGDDVVGLFIDPFGTFTDGNEFQINPAGATNMRVNGGRAAKIEWIGAMEARSRRTPDGWVAEARIPWTVMRLPTAGKHDLRVNFFRGLSRTQRGYQFANTVNGAVQNTPIWRGVEVPAKSNQRPLQLLPYVYGGYDRRRGIIANSGLDLKYGLSDDLDVIGTVSPDFRNVENQVLDLDFSYFERIAGEARPFFLEGRDYFNTSFDAPIFIPQRIQSFDTGLKVYGKATPKTQVGLLSTQDFGSQDALVGSVRHNLGPRTNLRFAGSRLARRGLENSASFMSLGHGWSNYDAYLQYQTTRDTAVGQGRRVNTGAVYFRDGLFMNAEWAEVTPGFLPRLGFAPRRGYRGYSFFAGYDQTLRRGRVMEWGFGAFAQDQRTFRGGLFQREFGFNTSTTLRDGTDIDFGASWSRFGQNRDRLFSFDIERPRGDPYRNASLNVESGRVAGKEYFSLTPSVSVRPYARLQLAAYYQYLRHFDTGSQTVFSASWERSLSDSFSGRLVQQGSAINWYLAYRRAGLRGAEYFVILGDPNAQTFRTSLVVKAVIPVEWRF